MNATFIFWQKYMHKTVKHPEEIAGMLIQPLLWVVLFGVGMGGMMKGDNYMTFMIPGIVALTAVGAAIAGGSTWLNERLSGIVKKYRAAPVPRVSILSGHVLTITTKVLIQALIIFLVGLILGAELNGNPFEWLGGLILIAAFGIGFSGLALAAATMTDSSEGYHMLIFLLQMPLLFLSNSLYPLASLPLWMRIGALANPTTYVVTGLRQTALDSVQSAGAAAIPLWICFAVSAGFALAGLAAAAKVFKKEDR
ncbi:MAG: ABC transporter permease [Spirochaetales bacterium]|nr:ABC transporter permease [Spirochaetales bacterium]